MTSNFVTFRASIEQPRASSIATPVLAEASRLYHYDTVTIMMRTAPT